MQESTCKHCGVPIYNRYEGPQPGGYWSSSKVFYDLACVVTGDRHEPTEKSTSLETKKHLLSAKEIMHRDLMTEIEDLRREIAQEELKKWIDSGGIG